MDRPTTVSDATANSLSFRSLPAVSPSRFFLAAFVIVTALAIFVPLNPDMPDKGVDEAWLSAIHQTRGTPDAERIAKLDESWMFALNAAVDKHFRFGKDVIFTFGPYASIYTRSFHPATDRRMILGSILLGVSYAISLLSLAAGGQPYSILILLLVWATFPSADGLLLSYPFILVLCALKFANSESSKGRVALGWRQLVLVTFGFSALGLLPLIKGSLVLPAAVSLGVLCVLLFLRLPIQQALPLLCVPVAATAIFWIVAGQALSDLPAFMRTTMWLTSGYTEAMATPWTSWPVIVGRAFLIIYLAASAVIYLSTFRCTRLPRWSKWLLCFFYTPFLLVAFKHGFVRSDHAPIAFTAIFAFTLIIGSLYADRYLIGSLVILLLLVVGIYFRLDPLLVREVRESFGTGTATSVGRRWDIINFIRKRSLRTLARVTYGSTFNTYTTAWDGLRLRLTDRNNLQQRYVTALSNVRKEYAIPALKGTSDIYTYEQALLLASGTEWDPRPVFQSYSAYTPMLARLNEQHLRGASAPDWILFDLMTIDERLPSLEDGMSWLALMDNYQVSSFDGQFLFLLKKEAIQPRSDLQTIFQGREQIGSTVILPQANGLLYAEVGLKPTLAGRVLTGLFKPPQLDIVLNLRNGTTKTYRVISNMMLTGFIVSPLVSDTSQLAALASRDREFEDEEKVDKISIAPSYGGSMFWASTYTLTLKTYHRPGEK
jgi:hypothetical protein